MRAPSLRAALPLALLAACLPSQSQTQVSGGPGGGGGSGACASCRRGNGASGGGASSGSSSGGGTTGAATTSGGSSGGADDGGPTCAPPGGIDGGGTGLYACTLAVSPLPTDAGCNGTPLLVQAVDISACQPVCGASLGLVDQDGVIVPQARQIASYPWATATLCGPAGAAYSPTVSAPQYPTFYYGEIAGEYGGPYLPLKMLPETTALTLTNALRADPSKGILFAYLTLTGSCGEAAKGGWTFSLVDPDGGGPWADGGYQVIYFGTNDLPSSSTVTTPYGLAVLYDIDTTPGNFVRLVYTRPDAGACVPLNASLGFTGRVFLQGSGVSEEELLLP